ncbi:S1/P1 Nuclease [Mucilaginibacter sp. HC2]|uniref:zinc dependent phospholipase C family protein n=1 Tax=Mucilaginibacter inviolabilis TaxID=2714892 RepID=UPI00140C217D|nr:zinc dependent phospholipase C family protein [Mucilaginibacter inviolabilis]NHA04833.1 S1/P1 Nuclease [Mucilaginibacter inviolabilis]
MKRRIILSLSGIGLMLLCSSWGFFAHYRINRLAVFTLPKGMAGFYKANIGYITEHAVSADKRRYVDSTENPHHFFDADHYGKKPFAAMPRRWADAAAKYSADTLNKYGTVPWTIQYQYYRLVRAFKAHDTTAILNASAYLGHYVADAHVPLHLAMNYDGQFTDQIGIHGLWETRLPELFIKQYNLFAGRARYIDNPLSEAFKICQVSFKSVDSVLQFERIINKSFPSDKKYSPVMRGKRKLNDYSVAYSHAYHKMLKGMVERQMRASIRSVGSFWYSAWVDAGQPDLNKLIAQPLSSEDRINLQYEEAMYKTGKCIYQPMK